MGLDAVEIVMAVEDAFSISIEDAEAEKVLTPRALIELVLRKVQRADTKDCLTQRSFNLLRTSLIRNLSLKRRDIAPSVLMADLVQKPTRRKVLEQIAADVQTIDSPALVRPRWVVSVLAACSVIAGIATTVALLVFAPSTIGFAAIIAGCAAAAATGILARAATTHLCSEFSPLTATVGDFSRWIMAHKPDLADQTSPRWTREQVAARVREIVIDTLACEKNYREDASFVKDLGLS
jgi:acyl carrier protein